MRLDKFLKITRVIKRRSVAQELCDNGNVVVNKDVKKPSYTVKENDIIEVNYFNKTLKVKVIKVPTENIKKEEIEKFISFVSL